MDVKARQSRALLKRMFSQVPRLSSDTAFIAVQLDNCKVYIPVKNIRLDLVDPFVKTVLKLYDETQKERKNKS